MERQYILAFDQSTQATKCLLFDDTGQLLCRSDVAHRQIINESGWVSHDPEEIYRNLIQSAGDVIKKAGVSPKKIRCCGISNQRETALAWNRATVKPVCDAVVWQCSRAASICERLIAAGLDATVKERTGIPISPYFPAAKLAWILENIPEADRLAEQGRLCLGTIDSWLIFKLTGGEYKTDYSNASRTQLFNITELRWDPEVCEAFGIAPSALAQVCDSDGIFGTTDLDGLLPNPIPICGVLGDSHGALFGQGCHERGGVKATYGTGSSVMMNIGEKPAFSSHGLVTSLAWKCGGRVQYVMEGNLNYTGAVVSWMQDELGLIASAAESQTLAQQANPEDTTYLVPAFSGLGAPYWASDAKAVICGLSRLTGKAELVRAGLECIAYQITDIIKAMEQDSGVPVKALRVDGGPTRNAYLMQFQSSILNTQVQIPDAEELSGIGAAYMAGISCGLLDRSVFARIAYQTQHPAMTEQRRTALNSGWLDAVRMTLN